MLAYQKFPICLLIFCSRSAKIVKRRIFRHFVYFHVLSRVISSVKSTTLNNFGISCLLQTNAFSMAQDLGFSEAVRIWYMLFTKIAATTGFYIHPYFCFRKHANSDYRFTCGFDVGAVGAVTAVVEVLHRPHVPKVLAVAHVPADPANNVVEVLAVIGVPKVLEIAPVAAVIAVPAIDAVQHDLHGVFQQRLANWNSQIWIAMAKLSVFKKHSPQHQILHQNSGQGYAALFQIISDHHPVLS